MRKENLELKRKMYGLLDKYDTGDLSQNKFCTVHGISVSVLKYWKTKRKKEQASTGFIAVEVPLIEASNFVFQFHYPNGVRLECPVSTSAEQIEHLIRIY